MPVPAIGLVGRRLSKLGLISRDQNFYFDLTIYPLAKRYSHSVGVIIDQHWVDMKRVSEWIKCCDTTHGKCYCRKFHSGEPLPCKHMYLIDLSQNCLVEANGRERYVALSYVWGAEQQPFRTSRANLTLLQKQWRSCQHQGKAPRHGSKSNALYLNARIGTSMG